MPGTRRVALVCLHTSPLDAPGTGDAGGMNVYVSEVARHLARGGDDVDVFTRTDEALPPTDLSPPTGGRLRVVGVPVAGPGTVSKEEMPAHLPEYAAAILSWVGPVAPGRAPYDVLHSHYWLSGEVGAVLATAWHVPLVHTMHTIAAVKNALADRSEPDEPPARLAGERRVAAAADALVASTADEVGALHRWYDADLGRAHVVPPGVDTELFAPGGPGTREVDRLSLGVSESVLALVFVGRVQPHKAPDLLLRAVAEIVERRPELRARLLVAVVGGPSGDGLAAPTAVEDLARELGVAELLRRVGAVSRSELARWYRTADVVVVPSRHESFGLVALEAQASGTPVVAARVGGLPEAVADGESGVLVAGREPGRWADAIARLLDDPGERARLRAAGPRHAARFSWAATARGLADVYDRVLGSRDASPPSAPLGSRAAAAVTRWLTDAGVEHTAGGRPGEVVAVLPGERRKSVVVSLLAGGHTLSASAFLSRRPDEDAAAVHEWLLRRNARLPGVAFATDAAGDVYVVGRVPVAALAGPGADGVLDDLLGAVAQTVEESFDAVIERGFASSVRAEHAWRVSRGLPVDNLAAFTRLLDPDRAGEPPAGEAAPDPGASGRLGS